MIKTFLKTTIVGLLILILFCSCGTQISSDKTAEKPNVIIIYTDDLGYGDVSCYNPQSKINTPNIDKLAADGMRFTDAHSPASFCTPSRYSILTGRYCWRSQRTSELQGGYGEPIIKKDELTLGNLFQNNGYSTAAIGKWHVGMKWTLKDENADQDEENIDFESPLRFSPVDQGFDYYFGTSGCTSDDPPFAFIENKTLLGLPLTAVKDLQVVGDFNRTTKELYYKDVLVAQDWAHEKADTIFTNRAIDFIQKQVKNDTPFFVYLPLSLPHIPWLPAEFVKGTTGDGPRGDLVALADYCVREIVTTLQNLGVEENTIVIFTSDNGPREGVNGHQSAGKLRGYKGSIYEGGHRVPFIIKWPGRIAGNAISDELIGQVDLYATMATILGHPLAENEAPDSYDFTPALLGQEYNKPIRETYIHLYFGVRKGDWKLIFDLESIEEVSMNTIVAEELYNLKDDPAESNNLIDKHPELVEELKSVFIDINNKGYSRPKNF
jgi:arylsulfatase A-like enzyme